MFYFLFIFLFYVSVLGILYFLIIYWLWLLCTVILPIRILWKIWFVLARLTIGVVVIVVSMVFIFIFLWYKVEQSLTHHLAWLNLLGYFSTLIGFSRRFCVKACKFFLIFYNVLVKVVGNFVLILILTFYFSIFVLIWFK